MADLFKEILPSLLKTKERCISSENEKEYVPFIVNRAISQHQDCIFYANEINKFPHTPRLLQYDFYLNSLRSWKRPYQKWVKYEPLENLELIKKHYGFSSEKAKDALRILTEEQIHEIKKLYNKGGIQNESSTKRHGGNSSE